MDKKPIHKDNFSKTKMGSKESHFTTPNGYFKKLENNLQLKLLEEKIPTKTSFNVSANYFENLEKSILNKVSSPKKETKIISLKQQVLRFTSISAAAVILLLVSTYFYKTYSSVTFDDLTQADLEKWYNQNTFNFSSTELAFVLNESDFEEDVFLETSLKNTELEEYLQNVDTSNLFE